MSKLESTLISTVLESWRLLIVVIVADGITVARHCELFECSQRCRLCLHEVLLFDSFDFGKRRLFLFGNDQALCRRLAAESLRTSSVVCKVDLGGRVTLRCAKFASLLRIWHILFCWLAKTTRTQCRVFVLWMVLFCTLSFRCEPFIYAWLH